MSSNGAPLPPQNLEAEESVLGAMMVSEVVIDPVVNDVRLEPEDFYRDRHGKIFEAVRSLYGNGEPVDALTVSEELLGMGALEAVGGKERIASLASNTPAPGNAAHYAQIVKQNSMLRRLLAAGQTIQQSVHGRDGDPRDLVEQAEKLLFGVAHKHTASDFSELGDILVHETDRLEKLSKGELQMTGTPSGYRRLDEITGGFQPGNLIILAARPAMGKSSLVCNIAENVAWKAKKPVAFFSLEMSEIELAHRFIASRAAIPGDRLRKGQVSKDWNKVVKACNELTEAPLWIDDSSDLSLLELRAKSRRLHSSTGGLGLIIVDYIQLMRADDPRAGRVEQVGQMSRGLKILARELEVPVIGISQLSRAPEQRKPSIPQLSDLRESGCLVGSSRVYLPDDGSYARIDELVGGGPEPGVRVLALNTDTWKLEPRPVTNAFSTGRKRVFELTTQLGRRIEATANHRFLSIDGWRRLDQLEPGTHLALPRELGSAASGGTMTEDELALLGHLIGDGCTLPRHAIQYTSKEQSLAESVGRLATRLFGDRVAPRVKRERTWYQVYLASSRQLTHGRRNPVAEWLDGIGAFGLRSYEKRVPRQVFLQPDDRVATFLRHLWATDGCVWLGRGEKVSPRIYYGSSSEQLARDVQSLLLRFGITSRLKAIESKRGRRNFHVIISGAADQLTFLSRIGALGRGKSVHGREILSLLGRRIPNTNRDVIPRVVWDREVKPSMAAAGVTSRELQAKLGMSYCGSTLYRANPSRARAATVAAIVGSEGLSRLAGSDVYWDQVASVHERGVEEVFDLTVDGLHNFVAEDIVVHNSIEQDADIVGFIYREEYYEPETERRDEADLIIAKHRNGPIGTVPLAFQSQYPRFLNFATGGVERGDGMTREQEVA